MRSDLPAAPPGSCSSGDVPGSDLRLSGCRAGDRAGAVMAAGWWLLAFAAGRGGQPGRELAAGLPAGAARRAGRVLRGLAGAGSRAGRRRPGDHLRGDRADPRPGQRRGGRGDRVADVFNLAALLGLAAVVAGWIGFHRRVVLLAGVPGGLGGRGVPAGGGRGGDADGPRACADRGGAGPWHRGAGDAAGPDGAPAAPRLAWARWLVAAVHRGGRRAGRGDPAPPRHLARRPGRRRRPWPRSSGAARRWSWRPPPSAAGTRWRTS